MTTNPYRRPAAVSPLSIMPSLVMPALAGAAAAQDDAFIPARKSKMILDAARTLGDGNRLGFPMRSGTPRPGSPLLVDDLEIAAAPHGFPSSFRDWAAEEADHAREVTDGRSGNRA